MYMYMYLYMYMYMYMYATQYIGDYIPRIDELGIPMKPGDHIHCFWDFPIGFSCSHTRSPAAHVDWGFSFVNLIAQKNPHVRKSSKQESVFERLIQKHAQSSEEPENLGIARDSIIFEPAVGQR